MRSIIIKYLNGQADKNEQKLLLTWLRKSENQKTFRHIKQDWISQNSQLVLPEGSENSWATIQDYILHDCNKKKRVSTNYPLFFKVAAIFLLTISIGTSIFFYTHQPLGIAFTSIVVEEGQICKVILPDSTLVWLNSGSKMTYNNYYNKENRDIKLSGEAYFQVRTNQDVPLIVSSGGLKVKVIGTKFNVNAYQDAQVINVTLEQGQVELFSSESDEIHCVMNVGAMASYNKRTQDFNVSKVNVSRYISWKDGVLNIFDLPLSELVKRLGLRYNQKFSYEKEIANLHFTFSIRNETLNEVIQLMESVAPIKMTQKADLITIELDENRKIKR